MQFEILGQDKGPVLVLVPGLMGGPEDFRNMIPVWETQATIIIPDPNAARREQGLSQLTSESMQEISFDSSAEDIHRILIERVPNRSYFFVGISLGGKIVYDYAIRFPNFFCGGVITDVGPESFEESELFKFVTNLVNQIDLTLPWPEMKKDLQKRIPDKNLRTLIQTQIFYPERRPPAIWKTGMKNFKKMLQRQAIDNQLEGIMSICDQLVLEKNFIQVLHADQISGISHETVKKMQELKCFRIQTMTDSSHFLHVTHRSEITRLVLEMLLADKNKNQDATSRSI